MSASGTVFSARTRRRARLASWRVASGERSTIGAISSNGTANMSCSTNASRSAGAERLEHHQQREPDRVGQQRLVLGVGPVGAVDDRLGHARAERLLRRVSRERSMFRETRPTTVVSQPPRFSTVAASVRFSRSHASWTASSASLSEPSIR